MQKWQRYQIVDLSEVDSFKLSLKQFKYTNEFF